MGPKAPEEGGRGPQRPPRPGRRRPGCSAEPDPRSSNLGSRPPALATRHGARAPGPRTLTRLRRRRRRPHRRPGTRKVGGNAAPPRLSLPAPPLAPRPPPAARAALPGPAPRAGPAPRGHPTGRSRPPGSPRGQEGSRLPGPRRSRAGSCLSSARLPPGMPGGASALAEHVRRAPACGNKLGENRLLKARAPLRASVSLPDCKMAPSGWAGSRESLIRVFPVGRSPQVR